MIIITHIKGEYVVKAHDSNNKDIDVLNTNPTQALLELGKRFPNKWIVWCEDSLTNHVDLSKIKNTLHHNRMMISDLSLQNPIPLDIHYIEESPFLKVVKDVLYPTWQMSSTVGAIHGGILSQLQGQVKEGINLDYALNIIARSCQSMGLLCYHASLFNKTLPDDSITYNTSFNPYEFVAKTFKKKWVVFLFLCHVIFEKRFPIFSFIKGMLTTKEAIKLKINEVAIKSTNTFKQNASVDVIIPTMGRSNYLYDVLKDFEKQTHLPEKIIIVEQNPEPDSTTDLDFITTETWPFKIEHSFIHETGACNARNLALAQTTADWVFFADDDIRFDNKVLEEILKKIQGYSASCLAVSCLQQNENKVFKHPTQWNSFPSGASMVLGTLSRKLKFNTAYEHGYGEDADYGMQLRNLGVDILYHPDVDLLHLKAPVGGFRQKISQPWESEEMIPKPSPTVMLYRLKHSTLTQLKGYKLRLFLRQLNQKKPLHLFRFVKHFKKRWNNAVKWAKVIDKR